MGGAGESTRRHFLWGQEDSGKGTGSSEEQAVTNLPLPSTEKPALGGSDLSVLGAPARAMGNLTCLLGCNTTGAAAGSDPSGAAAGRGPGPQP